jgi:hypothetical protein
LISGVHTVGEEAADDFISGVLDREKRVQDRKGKADLESSKCFFPKVNVKEKVIILPDTISTEDNYGMMTIVSYASELDYKNRSFLIVTRKLKN